VSDWVSHSTSLLCADFTGPKNLIRITYTVLSVLKIVEILSLLDFIWNRFRVVRTPHRTSWRIVVGILRANWLHYYTRIHGQSYSMYTYPIHVLIDYSTASSRFWNRIVPLSSNSIIPTRAVYSVSYSWCTGRRFSVSLVIPFDIVSIDRGHWPTVIDILPNRLIDYIIIIVSWSVIIMDF